LLERHPAHHEDEPAEDPERDEDQNPHLDLDRALLSHGRGRLTGRSGDQKDERKSFWFFRKQKKLFWSPSDLLIFLFLSRGDFTPCPWALGLGRGRIVGRRRRATTRTRACRRGDGRDRG